MNRRRTSFALSLCFLSYVYGEDASVAAAQALLKEGRAQNALTMLTELYRANPNDANICQQTGIAYTQLQDFAQAAKFYGEAVRLNPRFWAARKNLGTMLWFLDRKDESEREFAAVAKALPADPVPHLYLGLAAYARQDFSRAKGEFAKAGTLASENPEVLPAVIESYLATRDLDSATKLAAAHQDSPEVLRMLAEAYDRQGKAQEAYSAYSRAIDAAPESEDTYAAFAEFASVHGNNDFALEVIARGFERVPGSPVLLFEQGLLLAEKGDRSASDANFVQASKAKPDWPLPLLALGVSQLESGDTAGAAATFDKARTLDPRDVRALYLYATAIFRNRTSPEKAAEALRQAIQINPRDGRSHALLGQIELAEGRADQAADDWKRALEIDPENSTALYQLALLYRKQGKTTQAERLLQTFERVKAKKHAEEDSLVQILRVVPQRP